jgi:hypothetical protein
VYSVQYLVDIDELFARIDLDSSGSVIYDEMWEFYTKNFEVEEGVIDLPATKV